MARTDNNKPVKSEGGNVTMTEQSTTATVQPVVDQKYIDMAAQMKELIASGKSMDEALAELMPQHTPKGTAGGRQIVDRIAYINSLDNIAEVKLAIKHAFAKKSKSSGKPEAEARYDAEVKAGRARLNELMALVESSPNRIQKLIEMGEEASAVLQFILKEQEKAVEERLTRIKEKMKWTSKDLKVKVNGSPDETPAHMTELLAKYGPDFVKQYEERLSHGDMRIITLNHRLNLIDRLKKQAEEAKAKKAAEKAETKTETENESK